jgi:hypothetical protein
VAAAGDGSWDGGIGAFFLMPLLLSLFDNYCVSVDFDRGTVARKLAQPHTRTIPKTDRSVNFRNHAVAFYFEANNTLSYKPKNMCSESNTKFWPNKVKKTSLPDALKSS